MSMPFNEEIISVLDQIFGRLPISMVITDCDGKVVMLNDHYADFLNVKKEQVIGLPVKDVIPNTRLPIVLTTGQSEISQPHVYGDGVKSIVHRIPLKDESGRVVGCLGIVVFESLQELKELAKENQILQTKLSKYKNEISSIFHAKYSFDQILGKSPVIQRTKELAMRFAKSNADVLITGESGTGKELWAHAIHQASCRSDKPFVTVNCGAIPENLLESELFGYEEGAFTGAKKGGKLGKFQLAHGGTLFLDEIGDMPLLMQVKILRVLQEHEVERIGGHEPEQVDVCVIAATHRNLEQMIREGTFREDLYYRLNVLSLRVPALREHAEDIPLLVEHFVTEFCNRTGMVKRITPEALDVLCAYPWPGNIRELKALVERLLVCSDEEVIDKHDLPPYISMASSQKSQVRKCTLDKALQETEREQIERAMVMAHGNKSEAAKILGIPRTRLYRKLKQYGLLDRKNFDGVAEYYSVTK